MPDRSIPAVESRLCDWLAAFRARHNAIGATYGFTAAEVADLAASVQAWLDAHAAHLAAVAAARAARQAKVNARRKAVAGARAAVARLQAAPAMTDAVRRSYGLNVRDRKPTAAHITELQATRPLLQISIAQAQRHVIAFVDESASGRRAKPRGIGHIDLFIKRGGPAPASDEDWTYHASASASPLVVEFDQSEIGAAMYYRACWVSTRAQKGPWSAMAKANVPG